MRGVNYYCRRAADLIVAAQKKAGTRELVLSPLPWIVVYAVRDDEIHVVRILHGAQRWP